MYQENTPGHIFKLQFKLKVPFSLNGLVAKHLPQFSISVQQVGNLHLKLYRLFQILLIVHWLIVDSDVSEQVEASVFVHHFFHPPHFCLVFHVIDLLPLLFEGAF